MFLPNQHFLCILIHRIIIGQFTAWSVTSADSAPMDILQLLLFNVGQQILRIRQLQHELLGQVTAARNVLWVKKAIL